MQSESKWKQLGDLAMSSGKVHFFLETFFIMFCSGNKKKQLYVQML